MISTQEFITDHDTSEIAFHNFKVGNDGIMRSTYNISKLQGKGDTIFYTQRNTLSTGIIDNKLTDRFITYPNPTTDQINIALNENGIHQNFEIKLFNMQGQIIE